MLDILDWLRPVISGLIGALVIWLLVWLTPKESLHEGSVRHMPYGLPGKVLTIFFIPLTAFILYAALHASDDQKILALLLAAFFIAGTIFSLYHVFFTHLSYDDDYLYYQSPLAGNKKVPWTNLRDVGYSRILQSDFLVLDGIGRIWCSDMRRGTEELAEFLEWKIEEIFPEE